MEWHRIEIDEIIMNYLKQNADPFTDTPNTVLHRLLFGGTVSSFNTSTNGASVIASRLEDGPKALTQVLEMIREVIQGKHSRPVATKLVADRNGTAPQTIIDKYCRQLGKSAREVDILLAEPGLVGFRSILVNRFPGHRDKIVTFFNDLSGGEKMDHSAESVFGTSNLVRNTKVYGIATERKQRDMELENALKNAVGKRLREKFGDFKLKGQSQLEFRDVRVLIKHSSFCDDQPRWFWGISKVNWQNWTQSDYLSLTMENRERDGYSYLLFNPDEAKTLLDRVCEAKDGRKLINMYVYAEDNVVRLQDWKEFNIEKRLQPIDLPASIGDGKMNPVEAYFTRFTSATAEEQEEMIKKLKAELKKIK